MISTVAVLVCLMFPAYAQEAEELYEDTSSEAVLEETPGHEGEIIEDVDAGPPVEVEVIKPRPKNRVSRPRESQGTKAIRRFQTETVIKSPYKLKGVPLDVDPD